jgi:hypothetical protein
MNKRIISILFALTLAVLVGLPGALAFSQYLTAFQQVYTDGSCGTCHVDPAGGGPRNSYGMMFESQPNHDSNPVAALQAIGPASGTSPLATATATVTTPTATGTPNVTATPTTPIEQPRQPTFTTDVTQGEPGTFVSIQGTGWTPSTSAPSIDLTLNQVNPPYNRYDLGKTLADEDGTFNTKVRIPDNIEPGKYELWAINSVLEPNEAAKVNFTVLKKPTATETPNVTVTALTPTAPIVTGPQLALTLNASHGCSVKRIIISPQ